MNIPELPVTLIDKNPQVIFLDAVGTLFGVRSSVGAIYAQVAQGEGVELEAEPLDRAFYQAFAAATPLAFSEQEPEKIRELEFQWWRDLAVETFTLAGSIDQFPDFDKFFLTLYDYFATAEPWVVYPEVIAALTHWRSQDIKLGIISNFDSRIYQVLNVLELMDFFSSITISSEAGAAKPDAQIFTTALGKYNCPPTGAWHIGDSLREDYQGATQAGMRGILIKR
ncbi:MAG: HAD-IA family hydrolase [Coleofasciculaceae cyanobacterium SM2_1_6]|nr:HAD-IA family hydrolase [Coleofasciculaceae cyanobacterium SM2_1_6]